VTPAAVDAAIGRLVERNCVAVDIAARAATERRYAGDRVGPGVVGADREPASGGCAVEVGAERRELAGPILIVVGQVGRVLGEAAGLIERHGWVRGRFTGPAHTDRSAPPVCAVGAIRLAAGGRPTWGNQASREVELAFGRYLVHQDLIAPHADPVDTIGIWNDSRTDAGEVIAVLRQAARRSGGWVMNPSPRPGVR
jgi:hypothetical protein